MKAWIAAALAVSLAWPAAGQAAAPPTPLFAGDAPIDITIRGPISTLSSKRPQGALPGTLTHAATGAAHPIMLSPRGITRRRSDICPFPPLRVDFSPRPPAGSLFEHQGRLKLVTHCRNAGDFQQKVLLEYAAYRLYNLLTPHSFRVRLTNIDYVDDGGRASTRRVGFFIEDVDDVARRSGMVKANTPDTVPLARIDPRAGARFAVFNYMIGNLDWSMRAGPPGEGCCHNGRLIGPSHSAALLTPVPYDFDFSGFVDAPYATPPEGLKVKNVRQRLYRGYCAHLGEARAVASEMVGRRAELVGVLAAIPGLEERTRSRAAAYLDGFFADAASGDMFKSCLR